MSRAWILMLFVGCGTPSPSGDDTPPIDAPIETCTALGTCTWLEDYQRHIVGSLAGERDIAPNLRITHRASVEERDAARQFIVDRFTELDIPVATHAYSTGANTGANVIATLSPTAGTGPAIIVGAHFDSVTAGPGAADNATGVAIVLAAARYLRDVTVRNHPVVFALFDEEELGLIGSKAYAAQLVADGTEIAAVHVFDMLSFDGDGDRAVELWSPSPALLPIYQEHGALAGMPINAVTFSRSDHQSFLDEGFPAVGVGEEFESGDHTPHYHRPTDTYDRVSFAHCGAVTHLAFSILEASVAAP